jgi:hypothetical protein
MLHGMQAGRGDRLTYSGWEVRNRRDEDIAARDFKPIEGD